MLLLCLGVHQADGFRFQIPIALPAQHPRQFFIVTNRTVKTSAARNIVRILRSPHNSVQILICSGDVHQLVFFAGIGTRQIFLLLCCQMKRRALHAEGVKNQLPIGF